MELGFINGNRGGDRVVDGMIVWRKAAGRLFLSEGFFL